MSLSVFLTVSVFILLVAVVWVVFYPQRNPKNHAQRPKELASLSFYIPFVPASTASGLQPRLGRSTLNRDEFGLFQAWVDGRSTMIEQGNSVFSPSEQAPHSDFPHPEVSTPVDRVIDGVLLTDLKEATIDPSDYRDAIPVPAFTLQVKPRESTDETFEKMVGSLMDQIETDFKTNSSAPIATFTRIHERTLTHQRTDSTVDYYECFDRLLGEEMLSESEFKAVNQYRVMFLTGVKPRQTYLTEMLDSTSLLP